MVIVLPGDRAAPAAALPDAAGLAEAAAEAAGFEAAALAGALAAAEAGFAAALEAGAADGAAPPPPQAASSNISPALLVLRIGESLSFIGSSSSLKTPTESMWELGGDYSREDQGRTMTGVLTGVQL